MTESMTSSKPYIVRAFYDWISDNQLTPYIQVDTTVYGVIVPMAYITDGKIVLNVSMGAVGSISMVGDSIEFSARFGGKLEHISVPYGAISAIYAKENGAGTSLAIEQTSAEPEAAQSTSKTLKSVDQPQEKNEAATDNKTTSSDKKQTSKRPSLKVIK